MPFANFVNHADCVRQNPDKDDPDAYCGSIQARTENKATRGHLVDINRRPAGSPGHSHTHKPGGKLTNAVAAASHLNQAVRLALTAVVAKRDPVKEEGDKKLKEADGVAADGAQDDQPFAVAYGPDNYDKLTKLLLAKTYLTTYRAAGAIVKSLENKQMNFPGNLEDHLKKAHAAIHGREMWDARYGDVCDLLKRARKLLHDIEKTAEVAEQGEGAPQVMGKADPVDKAEQARVKKVGGRAIPEGGWKNDPFAGQRTATGAIDVSRTQPMAKPPAKRPSAHLNDLPDSGAPTQGAAWKALRKAVTSAARQAGR